MRLLQDWYRELLANWREAWQHEPFRRFFIPNFVLCFALYYLTIFWVESNSGQRGIVLNDPLYPYLPRYDFSGIIFFLTYSSTFLLLIDLLQRPYLLHRAFITFAAVFFIRGICIHIFPLSPSPEIVLLQDPITNTLAGEGHILNDLFFSGHVADLTTFYLLCRNTYFKKYILGSIVTIGIMLISQRVHYTIDVIAAPVFSYACYWLFVEKDVIWGPYLKKTAIL